MIASYIVRFCHEVLLRGATYRIDLHWLQSRAMQINSLGGACITSKLNVAVATQDSNSVG